MQLVFKLVEINGSQEEGASGFNSYSILVSRYSDIKGIASHFHKKQTQKYKSVIHNVFLTRNSKMKYISVLIINSPV